MILAFLTTYGKARLSAAVLFAILKYLFLLFLGICACVVLIKLAFGTLHIHITVDNPEIFIKQATANQNRSRDVRELTKLFKEEPERREPQREEETPQEKELRRFKEMLKSDGLLSAKEIDAITYEDLQKYKKGE